LNVSIKGLMYRIISWKMIKTLFCVEKFIC
jgi:hypothetical protein